MMLKQSIPFTQALEFQFQDGWTEVSRWKNNLWAILFQSIHIFKSKNVTLGLNLGKVAETSMGWEWLLQIEGWDLSKAIFSNLFIFIWVHSRNFEFYGELVKIT